MKIDNVKALEEIRNINNDDHKLKQLISELKIVFKDTESMDLIIAALVKIGEIDDKGNSSEKVRVLLETIMKNKIRDTLTLK